LSGDWLIEPFCRTQIHADTQHFGEVILNSNHIEMGQPPSWRELGDHINVRHCATMEIRRLLDQIGMALLD
jgi:hypothetical protein